MKNEKTDRRVKMTILILKDVLIQSMQNKHISKISVKQLCEIADINRSTFYSHFHDQYDLLEYICVEVIENLKIHLEKKTISDNMPISFQTLNGILDYVKENPDLFKALLSDNCDIDIQRKIMNVVLTYHSNKKLDKRTQDYLSAFGLNGCVSMLQIWLKDGMPESTFRMTEIIMQAINKGITSFSL